MSIKILTVDDSNTVRIIVRKAFKSFACEILEAQNGVEGLAMAAKTTPDIILLDITMPIMDGVEMLSKLKSDSQLKSIPVIMLTAEAGRENVMKIAKIGVRDYIVKPFKDELLIDKVARIVELRPANSDDSSQKKIDDPIDLLVVDDKPAIIDQITNGLEHTGWTVTGVVSTEEAIDFCKQKIPDCFIVSLSLPNEAAIQLFRIVRSNAKTKYLPIFGLSVKTEIEEQHKAQNAGFATIVTKPIDFAELEGKIAKAINLDASGKYFEMDDRFLTVKLPANCEPSSVNELTAYLKSKTSEAVDFGVSNVVFDAQSVQELDMDVVKLLLQSISICKELSLKYAISGSPIVIEESKKFEESQGWTFYESIEEAKEAI